MVSETERVNREKINLIFHAVILQLPLTQTAEMQTAESPHQKKKESIFQNVIGKGHALRVKARQYLSQN